ncbi:MAG: class I SAM-dependent methyltransferase [Acholeplasmataceae bacterium]|jgi:16S rRNA (guanine1207-N2)-methyltransferase
MSHYFTNDNVKSNLREIKIDILDTSFYFDVDHGVFSYRGLDFGTKILIENADINPNFKTVIDMGCGYGAIAITLARKYPDKAFFAYDINARAVELTKRNAIKNKVEVKAFESDLFSNVEVKADIIFSNPPIRAGKEVIFKLYEEANKNLNDNGELWIVIRTKQGAESTKKRLIEIFGNCETIYQKKGYRIYKSTKKRKLRPRLRFEAF